MNIKQNSDFEKFAIALYSYIKGIESYDFFYENIKDLDCHDFRFFFFKAHYQYAILKNIEKARENIDKSISAIPLINKNLFSNKENSKCLHVVSGNNLLIPLLDDIKKILSDIYTLAGEIY